MVSDTTSHSEVVEATEATEAAMAPQTVPINVFEAPGALVIVAPLPAVTPDDVTIELRGDCLRFWAHLRSAAPRDYLVHEWEYGGYEREVDIPAGYGGGIEASLANGQLAIRVLKGAAAGPLTAKPNHS
ncbi:MAG: Hsp20/alpha crystallin family protein [Acidimicrobiales bacterium]